MAAARHGTALGQGRPPRGLQRRFPHDLAQGPGGSPSPPTGRGCMSKPAPIRAHDRAHVIAVAVTQIIDTHPHDPVRAVAAYLRDEFTDLERQPATDLRLSDV